MRLTLLGCGTSSGVPLIQCKCPVCRSKNPKNKRLRSSAWLQFGSKNQPKKMKSVLIDTTPDLRQQALRANIPRVDAVLYTHPHSDHLHGIDDLRSFNFIQKTDIPVYGNAWTCDELKTRFPYIFQPGPVEGGGIPKISLNLFDASAPWIDVVGEKFVPLSLMHGSKECIGYRMGSIAYVTDCKTIPPSTLDRMKGLSVLILDCVRIEPHGTHFHLQQALDTVSLLKPKRTYLTHLSHDFDYSPKWLKKLPRGVSLAFDGLVIETN